MALASPIITDLLSLGTYAQDLYERCLLAPIHFREAKSELLALQTALSHLEFLTKSPLFAAGGGNEAVASTKGPVPPATAAIEGGAEKLAVEGSPDESNGNDTAVVKANRDLDVATAGTGGAAPNGVGVHQITSPENSPHIPPKTRADIAQLAAGCRGVLQSLEKLLEEYQGLNDIPVKPRGRGNGGIMQLFVGRPSAAIDRYNFAQDGVQRVNAIRAQLTYHTGAITLMLTVLGSSSLGRIEGSLSKLETMIAAAAEERERVHTNNVNYYLLAQQNNLNVSPEKQAYMKQRQQKGMGMGPLEFQNLSEQEYYTSMNMLGGGGGGMRGGIGPRVQKAKGEKQSGGFWGGGHADSEQFFSNINSWSGRPKSSGVLQSSNNRDSRASRDKPREMGFLSSLSRRNTTTGAEMSVSRGSRDENRKREKKQSDDWTDYMSPGWGDLRPKKTTKAQRLMLPPAPPKEKPTMLGGKGEMAPEGRVKEREGRSASTKRRERVDGEKRDKAKERRSKELDENAGRIEELEDDTGEGKEISKEAGDTSKPEKEEEATTSDKAVEVNASPERDEPKSSGSVKSKHSSRDQSDAAAAEAKAERHRRRKEREREREKAVGSGSARGHGPSAKLLAAPPAPPSPVKQKKFSWGLESHFLNNWEKKEKKPVKPAIAIPVSRKNRSVVNLQHGRSRAGKGEDGNVKSKSKSSKPLPEEDRERRKQRREQRKAKEAKAEDLGGISEEGAQVAVGGENPESAEKQSEEAPTVQPPVEEKEEETPAVGVEESPEVKEGGETGLVEGGAAAPAASAEDEAAKKERRKKRKEAKEAAEGKEGERKPSRHHSSHKPSKDKDHHNESSSRSAEKGKEKERSKEHREERPRDDRERKDKLRRQNTEPITEKERREHKSRSKTAPVGDKAGLKFDTEKDVAARRKMKEKESQAQQPASSSLWNKKVLAVARFSMGGQKQEETRRRSGRT